MTGFLMSFHNETRDRLRAEQTVQPAENYRRRALQFSVPALIGRKHFDDTIGLQANRADATQRIAHRDAPRHLEFALRERTDAEKLSQRARHDGMKRLHERSVTFACP